MSFHIACFLLLIYSFKSVSQQTETHLLLKYTQNDGLSSYNIHHTLQDPKGFMWIATQDGLNLFDGKAFSKYTENAEKTRKLYGTDIRWLITDTSRHWVWVLNPEIVLNAVDYETGKVVKTIRGLRADNDDWAVSMTLYRDQLWLGCTNGIKIYDIVRQAWINGPSSPFKKNGDDDLYAVRTIFTDRSSRIWAFFNHYGIAVIDGKTKNIIKVITNAQLTGETGPLIFKTVIELKPGELLLGTSSGLIALSYNNSLKLVIRRRFAGPLMTLAREQTTAMTKAAGHIYLAGNSGLYKTDEGLSTCIKIKESNSNGEESWLNEINHLCTDSDGNLWIGCKRGLAYLSTTSSAFRGFNNTGYAHAGLTHTYNLYPLPFGKILVGQEKSLLLYDSTTDRFSKIDQKRSFNFAFTDFNKRVIVSGDDGLYVFTAGKLIPVNAYYPELKPVSGNYINSAIRIGDSLEVIGSDNDRGFFCWNFKRRTLRMVNNNSSPIRLRSNIVKKIFQDSSGRLWVLSDFGIDVIEKDFSKVSYLNIKNPVSGNPLRLYFDICEVNGRFWLANYSLGIVEIDAAGKVFQVLNSANGLCNDGVYKIFRVDRDNLMVTSNNGLSVYNLSTSSFTNYYEEDGLHSSAFDENCGIESGGKIYAGGLNGFTIIDPKMLIIDRHPPKLYFTDIRIDSKLASTVSRNLNISELLVPDDALQTTISFTGLHYNNSKRVQYRYKIEELNDDWIDLGTRNFINIIGINPGRYHLSVESSNENGIWTTAPIRLSMIFVPKWYQTLWFEVLMILSLCSVLYSIYRYRIEQVKIQHRIRRDIANDLHDDLGSSLNSIKIFTHLAIEKKQNQSYLNEIETLITGMTAGLRDMLWVLEDSQDNIDVLMERIKNFVLPLAHANGIKFETYVDPGIKNQHLSKIEKRNLLLIAKEAINNCFKYSKCSNISVVIKPDHHNRLSFAITDDGIGFQVSSKPTGYGLGNMQHRAEQIGFQFLLASAPGKGTCITIARA